MDFPVPLSPKYIKLAEELNVRPEDIVEYIARGGGPGGRPDWYPRSRPAVSAAEY